MRVQRVVMPGSRVESWTVLGESDVPIKPVDAVAGIFSAIGR